MKSFRISMVLLATVGGALLPFASFADNVQINVVRSTYGTSLNSGTLGAPRNRVSSAPLSNHVDRRSGSNYVNLTATANPFEVIADSRSLGTAASSSAMSSLLFSPLQEQVADLDVSIQGYYANYFSSGGIQLYDLTAGQQLFQYAWNRNNGNIPWRSPLSANFSVDQALDTDHLYLLTMVASAQSSSDKMFVDMRLTGLTDARLVTGLTAPVPEPSTEALMLAGVLALGYLTRRRWRTSNAGAGGRAALAIQ